MLAPLSEVTTRVTVQELLLRALEERPGERIALHVAAQAVTLCQQMTSTPDIPLPATTTGQALQICCELTTLHPALTTRQAPT
ncbi:MAG: hypothetical protein JF597_51960 [Streptomyces sp.]|uniref:hypothetical protein n=1 Tax=Streptomyces sp. TaxID=1931 RepID=UPI0025F4652C|nr:hypothetical protein [Streptomyces sp.]MBW8801754.1 hypothetical protein [Streptomyces sp.]